MTLSVATARRGGAPRGSVLNTLSLERATRPLTGRGRARRTRVPRVPVGAAKRLGDLGIRVPGVEDVVLEVAADRDIAERDV